MLLLTNILCSVGRWVAIGKLGSLFLILRQNTDHQVNSSLPNSDLSNTDLLITNYHPLRGLSNFELLDEVIDLTIHNSRQIVLGVPDPMVCNTALRIVIGSDLF